MSTDAEPWRLFVALEVPPEVRDRLAGALAPAVAAHGQHLRFVPPSSWHATLAFLGEVEAAWADAVEAALAGVATRWEPFEVGLHRAGRFGRGVLFAGFDDAAYAAIRSLGADVRSCLDAAGVEHDSSALHPHVTIARPRRAQGPGISRSRLAELDAAIAAVGPLRWEVRVLTLLRSHLTGDGPRHEPLARLLLSP